MLITHENNPVLPRNANLTNVSLLKEFYNSDPFRSFSIKYVSEGKETYIVNGKRYEVSDRHYLLANNHSEGSVLVDSKTLVKGICIDVSPSIISDVTAGLIDPGQLNNDIRIDTFLNSSSFFENVYPSSTTHLGKFIEKYEKQIILSHKENTILSNEFYFQLAERIIKDHIPILKQLQNIKAVKPETRKMILYKLMCGKEIMDSSFLKTNYVAEIAKEIGLSEYHFFRLFKCVFGVSPNKYLINKRMNYAMEMLKNGNVTVLDVALLCSFPDGFSFSKSFKKHFGESPSQIIKINKHL
ncbi:MAG: helix-turn-helix transcriptional regulator [Bacteroidia bacterium]|nr:helix-turn-helix transcriptional regulator [Bacteroidia bacterium]